MNWRTPSFPIRVITVHFFLLALPLLIASFFLFHRFYEDQKRFSQITLANDATEAMLFLHSLAPFPTRGLNDVLLFLPKNIQGAEQMLHRWRAATHDSAFMMLSTTPHGANQYPVIGSGWGGMDVFTSGGTIETILRNGQGDFVEYFSDPIDPIERLIYLVGQMSGPIGGPPDTILLVKREIGDEMERWLASHSSHLYLILNEDRVVIKASDPKFEGHVFPPELISQQAWLVQNSEEVGSSPLNLNPIAVQPSDQTFVFSGQTYLSAISQQPRYCYSVIACTPYTTLFHDSWSHFIWIYVLYGLICIIGFLLTWFLSSWLARPLSQIRFVMNQVELGNFKVRYRDFPFGFEINELGHLFNTTLISFLEHIQKKEDERVLKESYAQELTLGLDVERSILHLPWSTVEGVTAHASFLMGEEVGGDFYCIDHPREGCSVFMIGDAAGKGLGSCLYGLSIRSLLRSYLRLYSHIGEVLSATNNTFLEQAGDSGQFVTVFLGAYEPATHTFTYFSCGHPTGLIKKKSGELYPLTSQGLALGLSRSSTLSEKQLTLDEGDLVVLYTKGLIEGTNGEGQAFSELRIQNTLQQRSWVTPQEVCEGLQEEYLTFTAGRPQKEEVIILAFQVKDA